MATIVRQKKQKHRASFFSLTCAQTILKKKANPPHFKGMAKMEAAAAHREPLVYFNYRSSKQTETHLKSHITLWTKRFKNATTHETGASTLSQ